MKKLLWIMLPLVVIGAWYLIWRAMLSDDVARVEATLMHHNEQFRTHNRWVNLKSDGVSRAGFPFDFRVRVDRPTLTLVWGEETYGLSLPWAELRLRDQASGTYEVTYAPRAEAVYAVSGRAPEEYFVTPREPIAVLMRAQGDSRQCSFLPGGQRCPAVGPTDPLISFAAQLPAKLTLTMELNGESKDAQFTLIPLDMPIYQRIPVEMDRPLQLFVGILREALVYRTGQ